MNEPMRLYDMAYTGSDRAITSIYCHACHQWQVLGSANIEGGNVKQRCPSCGLPTVTELTKESLQ